MSKLKRNAKIIFDRSPGHGKRFRARSLDGSTGWGVWDMRTERFLKDKEVAELTLEQIEEAWTQ